MMRCMAWTPACLQCSKTLRASWWKRSHRITVDCGEDAQRQLL
jgi:hypothetical protein